MPRFLHLADVHLGYDRYDSPARSRDFFEAFRDALERYAIAERVDFVLIVGDLFEHRQVLPDTLNQARVCLEMLREEGIPVLAIEGNHDYRLYGTQSSWLNYLAEWELLKLLELEESNHLEHWNPETRQGGYIDLPCGVRVIGSNWYGAAAPQAILQLAEVIPTLPTGPDYTVMMFHHGLEGQVARYTGALRYQDLLPLRKAGVDYLALGHIHRQYTVEDWIFNPGSVEANSVSENQTQNPRGVYLVNLSPDGIDAQLQQDYYQRPIVRLQLPADKLESSAAVEGAAIALVKQQQNTSAAIVELRITGHVRFPRLDLDARALRQRLHELSGALIFLLKYEVTTANFDTAIPNAEETQSRQDIEKLVFTDLLASFGQYRQKAPDFATGVIELKDKIRDQCSVADLYEFGQQLCQRLDHKPNPEATPRNVTPPNANGK
jgi:DNA repair protein SbcD/Mre11